MPVNPIHLTLATALVAFTGITAARVQLLLHALDLGAVPSQVGLLFTTLFLFPLKLFTPVRGGVGYGRDRARFEGGRP